MGKHTKSLLKYVTVIGHQSWETITAPIYHNLSLQEITGRGNPCENWWQLFNRQRIETDTVSNPSKDYFIVEIGGVLTYDYFSEFFLGFFLHIFPLGLLSEEIGGRCRIAEC